MFTSTTKVKLSVIAGLETLDQIKGSAATTVVKPIRATADALPNN